MHDEGSVYDGLAANGDDASWAFGTQAEDPLAGVDTSVPDGVDGAVLAAYSLMLGDDALVYSHRLSQWCSRAPDLEDDIALANVALDLLGQARLLLGRAAAADPSVVPLLPEGSPVPAEDALAYFRDDAAFRNVRFVEPQDVTPHGDFAVTITRLLVFATYRLALFQRLAASSDPVLAAIAAKGVNEVTYHRDYAGRWFLTLARGTQESRRRVEAALLLVLGLYDELFGCTDVERAAAEQGLGVDPSSLAQEVGVLLEQVFSVSGVEWPDVPQVGPVAGCAGRDGRHSEALSPMLAEMQSVARAHPEGAW